MIFDAIEMDSVQKHVSKKNPSFIGNVKNYTKQLGASLCDPFPFIPRFMAFVVQMKAVNIYQTNKTTIEYTSHSLSRLFYFSKKRKSCVIPYRRVKCYLVVS